MPPAPRQFPAAWLLYAVIAATCWGNWGVPGKGPSRGLSGWMTQVLFTFALIPPVYVACLSTTVRTGTDKPRGLFRGFVSGLIAAEGNICSYLAIEAGAETAIAILLTNVHPPVTIYIAYFWFKERLNFVQIIVIPIAVATVVQLSGATKIFGQPVVLLRRLSLTPWVLC